MAASATYSNRRVRTRTHGGVAGVSGQPLPLCRLNASQLHFELPGGVIFDGQLNQDIILGRVKQGDEQGDFHLIRIAKVEPQVLDEYVGTYQLQSNRFILIRRGSLGGLAYNDYDSGRFGVMFPSSEMEFFAGPSSRVLFPADFKVTFVKDQRGKIGHLLWSQKGLPDRPAKKVWPYQQEEVRFQNGKVTLSGTLLLPSTKGLHPALVLINHSTGLANRADFLPIAAPFAQRGVAVLFYDRRGEGASTGDWRQASFEDFAGDALAGVQFLETRREINSEQIGLHGQSQGGLLAMLAAARANDVAFIILVSPLAVTIAADALYSVAHQLRADGFSDNEIAEAVALQQLEIKFARTGEGWEEYQAAVQKARSKRWFPHLVAPLSKDHWFLRLLSNDYDPIAALEKVTCPVLAIFGGLDRFIPVEESKARIEQTLRKAGHQSYTIRIFPTGNHGLWEAETGGPREFARLKRFVPGFFDAQIDWLLKQANKLK